MKALLALEDGTVFEGTSFTCAGEAVGEVVFNTNLTGYQEVLTDPSYKGQIVTMTYPLIGTYGINDEDLESDGAKVEAFVVREYQQYPSNWRSGKSLKDFLLESNTIGIEGIDTRALTRRLRIRGAMKGIISTLDLDPASLVKRAREWVGLVDQDLVRTVTCPAPYRWSGGRPQEFHQAGFDRQQPGFRVAAIDTGIKYNILRSLEKRACQVLVLPAATSADDILALNPDGIFLSNGPGDPAGVPYVFENLRRLIGKKPIFGICLGHQMLGLALGGKTYKLKFGHRGGNQPVKNLATGKVEITSQNHGFCVDIDSMAKTGVELTHVNLNDNTLEGMEHRQKRLFSVQYHPEASPGPHDSDYLFDQFIDSMGRVGA
ncbi:MAG: glutamine-hydrolyzing carbamoyl-phosphate synthase small subunit [Deltaproteobacteria bacterium]|nr:glutamine-hydrolyzing carbamoyl-phosphate synthase small subunit [Deltaproteobacteria bacterium]